METKRELANKLTGYMNSYILLEELANDSSFSHLVLPLLRGIIDKDGKLASNYDGERESYDLTVIKLEQEYNKYIEIKDIERKAEEIKKEAFPIEDITCDELKNIWK